MAQIFSTQALHPEVTARLQAAGDYCASAPTAAAILAEGCGSVVLIVRAPIPPQCFAESPRLRAAVRHGAGLDMIPIQSATEVGVLVANVPGANASTVAEHAIFAAIGLLRSFAPWTPPCARTVETRAAPLPIMAAIWREKASASSALATSVRRSTASPQASACR